MSYEPLPPLTPVIPYASPVVQPASSDVWREGKLIVARNSATFPPRCVKCNADSDRPGRRRTYFWHHPGIYFLILAGLLVYVIVALIVRKKGSVVVCLCHKHRRQRLVGLLLGWICGVGGIVTAIAGAVNNSGTTAIVGIIAFIVGLIGGIRARLLYPKKIDDYFLWLGGGGSEFVQSLPAIPVPPTLPPAYPA